jgi:hypothetical protein
MQRGGNMNGASTSVRATLDEPREQFYYWLLSADPSKFLHSYAILPAVVESRKQTGPLYIPGSSREFVFSDGTTAFEEITNSDPPNSVCYRVCNLTSIFRYLVREGNARFTFSELQYGGTQIDWQYTFIGHNLLAILILQPLVSILWRGFMKSGLSRAIQIYKQEREVSKT